MKILIKTIRGWNIYGGKCLGAKRSKGQSWHGQYCHGQDNLPKYASDGILNASFTGYFPRTDKHWNRASYFSSEGIEIGIARFITLVRSRDWSFWWQVLLEDVLLDMQPVHNYDSDGSGSYWPISGSGLIKPKRGESFWL